MIDGDDQRHQPGETNAESDQLSAAVETLWERYLSVSLARIAHLERAARTALTGSLSPDMKKQAELEAHKLVGSLGTFGLAEGSRVAAKIEAQLAETEEVDSTAARLLLERVELLQQLLASHTDRTA